MTSLAEYLAANKALEVGQEVRLAHSTSYGIKHTHAVVTKVTPTGRVTVKVPSDTEVTFNSDGRFRGDTSMSGNIYRNYWLEMDVEGVKAAQAKQARAITASSLLSQVSASSHISGNTSKEGMLNEVARLEALLAEAKTAINLI